MCLKSPEQEQDLKNSTVWKLPDKTYVICFKHLPNKIGRSFINTLVGQMNKLEVQINLEWRRLEKVPESGLQPNLSTP